MQSKIRSRNKHFSSAEKLDHVVSCCGVCVACSHLPILARLFPEVSCYLTLLPPELVFAYNLDCSIPFPSKFPNRIIVMSTMEAEETQSVNGDGGAGGPGAPTPLSVLEVMGNHSESSWCGLED